MARTNVRINLTPDAAINALALVLERKVTATAMNVHSEVVQSLSVGQPTRRTKGGYLVGLNPSAEGEPPHVLYGQLRQGITWQVKREAMRIIAIIGVNLAKAARLELGFVGTDSKGRNIHQGPRPYLRPGLEKVLGTFRAS